jgi:hypothetical protein
LKVNKIRLTLCEIGGDSLYAPDLGPLLLAVAGFKEITDDLLTFYCKLIDEHAAKLDGDRDQLMKHAFKIYVELKKVKKAERSAGRVFSIE